MSDGTVRDSSGSTGRLSTESASSGSPPAVLASVEVFNSCAEDLTPQHELPKRVLSRHVYVDSTWTMSRVLSLVLESETYLFAQVQGETVTESGEAATAAAAAYSSSSSASLSLDSASTGRTRLCDTTGWQTFLATMSPRSHSSGSSATSSSRTSQSPRSQVAVRLRFFVCEDVKACTCLGCRFLYVKQSSRRVCNACNRGGRELPPGSVLRVHKDNEEEVSDLLGDEEHWKFVGPKPPTRRRTKKRSGRSAAGSPSDDDSNPCKETDVAYYAVFESQEVAKTVRREAQEQDVELDWIDMTLLRCMLRMVSHFWRLEVHYRFDDAQHALDLMRASESEDSDAAAAAAAAAAASRQSPISPVSSSSEEHPNTLTTETGAVYLLLDGDQRVRLVPAGSYPKSGKSSRKTASKNKRKADAVVTLPSPMDAAINRNPGLLLTPSTVHTPPMRGEQDLSTLSQLPPAEQAVPERARKALRLTEEPLERSFDASPAPSPAPSSMPTTYPTGASLLSIGPNSHTSELSLTERVVMLRSQDQQLEAQWTMMKRHQQQQQHIHRMVVDHIQAGGGHEMAAQDGTTPMQLLKRERDISDHIRRRLAEVEARRLQVRQELHNCRISLQDHHRKQALEQQVREQQLRAERQRIEARQQQLLLQQKRVHQLEHQVQQQPPPQQQQQQQQQLHQPQHQYQQPRTQLEQHMHLQRLREQQQQLHYQHQQLMQQQQQQRQHWNHAPSMQQHYAQLEQQSMFAPSGGHYDDPQSAFPFAPPPVEPIDMLPMDFEDPFSYTIGSGDIAIPDDSVVSQFLDPDDDVQMETVFKLQGGADEVDDGYVTADVGEEAREGEYVTADVVERVDALQGKHAATGSSIRSMQARLYASLRSMGTVKERARAADRLRRRAGATGDVDDERKSGDTDDDEEEEEDNEDQRPLWAAPAPEEPARRAPESRLRLWQNKLFALQFHELSILFMCMLALLGFSIVVHAMVVNDHPSHNDYAGFNLLRRSFDPARESRALYRSQQRGATLLHGLRQLSPAFNAWAVAEIKASRAQTLLNSPGVLDPLSLQPDVLNAVCGEMVMHNEHVDAALASLQSDPLAVSSAPVPPPPNNAPECTSLESTTLGAAWLSHLCRGDDNLRVRLSNADPDCVLCSIGPSQSCSTASSPAVCSAVRQHVLNVWVPSISTVAEAAVDEDTAALVATLHVQSARGRWANAGGAASSICFEAASLIADAQSNAEDRSQSFMVSGWMLLLVMLTSAALPTLLYVALSVFECRCPRWLRPAKKWRKPRRESRASRVALVPPPPSASGSSSRSRSRNTVVPAPAEVAM